MELYNLLTSMYLLGRGNTSEYAKATQRLLRDSFNWEFPDTPLTATVNGEKILMLGYKVLSTTGSIETVDCMLCTDSIKTLSESLYTAFEGKTINTGPHNNCLIMILTTGQLYTVNEGNFELINDNNKEW